MDLLSRWTLLGIRCLFGLYVLLVVVLSAWVLGAALRLGRSWPDDPLARLRLAGVSSGACILGDAEAKDRPAASSISTGMTEERDGLISDVT